MRSALPLTARRRGPSAVSKANSSKDGFPEASGSRRPQQASPLERAFRLGQSAQKFLHDFAKQHARSLDGLRRDRLMSIALPAFEERFEHLVDELPLRARIHDLFVFGLLFQPDDVLREELEWTAQVSLECAD